MEQTQVDKEQLSTQQSDAEKRPGNDNRRMGSSGPDLGGLQSSPPASRRERWDEFRPSKTIFFWSLVGAVVLTVIVGFNWGGWTTSANAQKMADTAARSAVVERLAPMCVAQFNQDSDSAQKLIELQESSSYQRTRFVSEQGWATLGNDTKADSQVAAACSNLLMQIGQ